MEERLSGSGGEILAAIHDGVATVTLNRPAALNALTFGMLQSLASWLDQWERDQSVRLIVLRGAGERAFCAGGDIRELHDSLRAGRDMYFFFETEYELDFRIHTYPKPIVALIDGIVMGGGMGISQGARLRVVGERTRMAMPETAIGLFPDVGGSFFLSRVPGRLGEYLGLVGCTIRAADAIYCGLADQYVGAARLGTPELERLRPAIDRHFGHASVEAIVASLASEHDPALHEWAKGTLDLLAKRSPTMLKVTLEQLRRAKAMTLAECFRMEFDLLHGCFEHGDFLEGVRALIVDKDKSPRWKPGAIDAVDRASVERFFRARPADSAHPLSRLG